MKEIKTIGRRIKALSSLENANNFLKTIIELRRGRPFLPRGVYRFKTFEEAQDWSIKMMTKHTQEPPQ